MTTIVYHGSKEELKLENKLSKRYRLLVLFFTTEKRLANMYASKKQFVYQVAIKADKIVDFNGQISHSRRFRNLIFELSREGHNVVAIENVFDRPSDHYPFEKSTIYVIFDLNRIKNFVKCIH